MEDKEIKVNSKDKLIKLIITFNAEIENQFMDRSIYKQRLI